MAQDVARKFDYADLIGSVTVQEPQQAVPVPVTTWWQRLRLRFQPKHEWDLICGRSLFLRCGRCGHEFHAPSWQLQAAFVSCKVPVATSCVH